MKSGIYRIINTKNSKFYIGSAVNLKARWNVHLCDLRKNRHCNIYLQRSYNKYGEELLKFEILEYCELDILLKVEQKYIDQLKPDYNICKTAGSTLGFKKSEESKRKQSDRMQGNQLYKLVKNRPDQKGQDKNNGMRVYQCTLEGLVIGEYRSITYASQITGIDRRCITNSCKTNTPFSNHLWKFKNIDHDKQVR